MPNNNNNNSKKQRGSGYLAPAEFFNPEARQPSGNSPMISSAPQPGWVRPPMSATMGGRRLRQRLRQQKQKQQTRRRGGFAPSIMGGFVSNVQSVVVPLVLAGVYAMLGEKPTAKPVSRTMKSKSKSKSLF